MKTKPYYECHVTFTDPNHTNEPDDSKTWAPREPKIAGWIYSRIDGDPVLGRGVKSYLTRQFKGRLPLALVVGNVEHVAAELALQGFHVLRRKVERVVYDTKQIPDSLLK